MEYGKINNLKVESDRYKNNVALARNTKYQKLSPVTSQNRQLLRLEVWRIVLWLPIRKSSLRRSIICIDLFIRSAAWLEGGLLTPAQTKRLRKMAYKVCSLTTLHVIDKSIPLYDYNHANTLTQLSRIKKKFLLHLTVLFPVNSHEITLVVVKLQSHYENWCLHWQLSK